jgi:hypothetical protein
MCITPLPYGFGGLDIRKVDVLPAAESLRIGGVNVPRN